jgi:cysteine synthase A
VPGVIDEMFQVPDAGSLAAIRLLRDHTGHWAGGSTGTNLYGAFLLISRMIAEGQAGSVVTLLCDGGERYANTYYSDEWLAEQEIDIAPYRAKFDEFLLSGKFEG